MRIVLGSGLVLSCLVMLAACGGEEDHAPSISSGARPSGGSGGSRGGSSGRGGEGGEADPGEPQNPKAPTIEVTSPEPVADPDDGEVLTSGDLEVVCNVKKSSAAGSKDVDVSTVRAQLLDGEGNVVAEAAAGPTDNDDEFSATLTVPADLPNGAVSVQCVASDSSAMPLEGRGSIETFVDQGPTITVIEPSPASKHALQGAIAFEFEVDPAPLAKGDDGADVDDVTLDVNGIPIEVTKSGNSYTTDIDFNDPLVFSDTPTGTIPVLIRASNSRSPDPIVRQLGYDFVIDGTGPTINVTSHKSNDVVGGQVVLQFKVTDDLTGVNRNTVSVKLNSAEEDLFVNADPWTESNGTYTYSFDSRNIQTSKVQITVNVNAKDNVGNESSGASLTLWIDNTPPSVDLDPSNVRDFKLVSGVPHCSSAYDPVGDRAVNDNNNDQDPIGQIATFRAAVWEETNGIPDQVVFHYAGTDTSSVYLYLQPDPSEALLVDTDGDPDNLCDELATTADFLQLAGITPTGSALYDNEDPTADPDPGSCVLESTATPPDRLCDSDFSDMFRVLRHPNPDDANGPAIFAKPELVGLECTGAQWEIGPFIDADGWICLAVRAEDVVGNVGISRPLRACYDSPDIPGAPACATMSTTPPDCTDGCTPPPRWGSLIIKE